MESGRLMVEGGAGVETFPAPCANDLFSVIDKRRIKATRNTQNLRFTATSERLVGITQLSHRASPKYIVDSLSCQELVEPGLRVKLEINAAPLWESQRALRVISLYFTSAQPKLQYSSECHFRGLLCMATDDSNARGTERELFAYIRVLRRRRHKMHREEKCGHGLGAPVG